jgi:hypothetical protein
MPGEVAFFGFTERKLACQFDNRLPGNIDGGGQRGNAAPVGLL